MRQHNLNTLRIRGDSGHTIHLAFDNVTEPLLNLRMRPVTTISMWTSLDSSGVTRYIRTKQLLRCSVVNIVAAAL